MPQSSSRLPKLDICIGYPLHMPLMEACTRFEERLRVWPQWAYCPVGHVYTHSNELNEWLARHNITVGTHPSARGMWCLGPIPGGDDDTDSG